MSCDDCRELSERLVTGRRRFVEYRKWTTESLGPLFGAISALDTPEGRANFVMSGPRCMATVVRLYNDLPEELKVGK